MHIVRKDVATFDIEDSLLEAEERGFANLLEFVNARMVLKDVSLKNPLHRNNPLTFSNLYVLPSVGKDKNSAKAIKVDRNILQRLITAFKAQRPVNLEKILQHELMQVPLSLASTDGNLLAGTKSILSDILTKGVTVL